jgi:carboxyl-terminal processing protease
MDQSQPINKILLALTLIFAILVGVLWYDKPQTKSIFSSSSYSLDNKADSKSNPETQLVGLIKSQYLRETPDDQKLIEAKNRGIVNSLNDPYSEYITKSEKADFESNLNQQYKGIGIRIEKIDTLYIVTEVLKNSPAQSNGVLQGDIIFKINEDLITPQTSINQIVQKIRGEEGTKVKIQFIRSGKPLDLDIQRADIKADLITYDVQGRFGIITISSFGEGLDARMKEISGQINQNPSVEKIIIDVRSDTGGLLDQAIDVLSYFVEPNTTIVQEKSKNPNLPGEFLTTQLNSIPKQISLKKYPVFVLTDKFSASASEILAGALRDIRGAKIYGEKTFGKGVVQQLFPLSNGDFVKLTIAEWLTPGGKNIDKTGIDPDVDVPQDISKSGYDAKSLINKVILENL